ncbi:MAG: amidohydrolase family protein [Acidobacteria bacterium]|nr:amidohydrolase family protein [Acidobacteriota bacterium]
MREVDLIVSNADWLITLDDQRQIYRDGAVAVAGNTIVEVGKSNAILSRYQSKKRVSARRAVVIPGFVDGHLHSSFQMSRGLADEVGSQQFLFERMYPYEAALSADDSYLSSLLCTVNCIRHGVTCFIDPGNYHPEQTVKAIAETGIRAIVAKSSMDIAKSAFGTLPPRFQETTESALATGLQVIKDFHNIHNGRIRASLSFRGVNNCTDELIRSMKQHADESGVLVQAHACFAKETRDASLRQHRLPEIERLHAIGALGPNVLLIHCGWLSPKEVVLLREFDVKVVACASSSMHNAYGNILMGSIPELLEMGVSVSVGSDHACSGIVDLTTEMFVLSTAYKEVRLDPAVMPPEKVLEMATRNGAACALWKDEIGSLEAGKKADIAIFGINNPDWLPLYNPISNLIYAAPGNTARTVIVDGSVIMEEGRVQTVDEEALYKEVLERQEHILEVTGLAKSVLPKWPTA